jgi:hypothetical protein
VNTFVSKFEQAAIRLLKVQSGWKIPAAGGEALWDNKNPWGFLFSLRIYAYIY